MQSIVVYLNPAKRDKQENAANFWKHGQEELKDGEAPTRYNRNQEEGTSGRCRLSATVETTTRWDTKQEVKLWINKREGLRWVKQEAENWGMKRWKQKTIFISYSSSFSELCEAHLSPMCQSQGLRAKYGSC